MQIMPAAEQREVELTTRAPGPASAVDSADNDERILDLFMQYFQTHRIYVAHHAPRLMIQELDRL